MNYKKLLPVRIQNSHKGMFGKILNISGSKNYTGAAYLSSISALRTGAGYVTLATSDYVCKTVASLTPDITFLPLQNLDDLDNEILKYDVISLGCGLGQNVDAQKLVEYTILKAKENNIKIIIDADGLNILAKLNIQDLGNNFILTPHVKELSRLLNIEVDEIINNRVKYAQIASDKYNCTVILKGNKTVITNGQEVFINKSGNSALAKAGTGDVLTGIIAGLIAQHCKIYDAARLGVYIHGICANLYSKKYSEYSMLASDMLNLIPDAIKKI